VLDGLVVYLENEAAERVLLDALGLEGLQDEEQGDDPLQLGQQLP
jgi:hypothetical protein